MLEAMLLIAAISAPGGWHDARAIVVTARTTPAYVRLVLPQSIDGGPQSDYASVRVAGPDGREVPYALDAWPKASTSRPVSLSDVGFVAGKYTQAIADLGDSGELHSTLELITPQPTFFQRVQIATSDDRRTWTIVTPKALIYRVAQNNDAGQSSVEFGPSRARWLRIRILDATRAFPLTAATVTAQPAPVKLVPMSAVTTVQNGANETGITLDFQTPNANLGAVAFETQTPDFSRRVSFGDAGDDATISRFAAGRPALTADLGNLHVPSLHVAIDNGNDPPLAALRVTPLGFQHHLIFLAEPGAAYRLLWNDPDATAPSYDLAERLAHETWRVDLTAALGAAATTQFVAAAPVASTPWLQRAALPLALVLACLVLGAVALLGLRAKSAV
jgi:hypothetical protein